ncbi:MAG: 4-hydroxyphenylpyruvate dioxygenase [bacterium]|nr:4-hydroxyphenylpyruvate dioxygenase [bacterium]
MYTFNPLGIIDFDHIQFTVQDATAIDASYDAMGFTRTEVKVARGYSSHLFKQGAIRVIVSVNAPLDSFPGKYREEHGDGVCTIGFRVHSAEHALQEAVHRGAKMAEPVSERNVNGALYRTASIQGFGAVRNLFVERPDDGGPVFLPGYTHLHHPMAKQPLKFGLERIDHMTNNVPEGEMDVWVEFYKRIYGFEVVRDFDIKGLETGLLSKVVASHDRKVIIPINEPQKMSGKKGQIEEFLDMNHGHGVQHVAFRTANLMYVIQTLRERGLVFLDAPPDTYYDTIPNRVPGVRQPLDELKALGILVDGDPDGYLLQLFTKYMVGPLFYEFIQREKHDGFGEGNFQALFDSIEADQRRRGVL